VLTDDPERRAQAQLQVGRALYWAGRDEEGVRVVEEALNEWTHADDLRRRLEATLVANATRLARRLEEARRLLDSLELDVGDGQGARMLLCLRAYHEAARGGNRERAAAEAQHAFGAMSDDERRSAYVAACYTLLVSDHLDETVHLLDALIARAHRVGAVFNFAGLSIMRATFHYARGALPEAEADARTALEAVPDQVSWGTWAYGWLAQILVERGAVHEAAATVNAGEDETPSGADSFSRLPLLRAGAVVAVAHGDHQTALADAVALGETLAAYGHSNPAFSYPSWRSLAAQAQFGLGRTDEALRLIREDVTQARAWGAPRTLGRALRMLGVLEGAETGLERLREAVGLLEHSPARLEHAYALADLGGALRRANRRTEARQPLRRALEVAHQCGAMLLAEHAHEELVAAGARPRRRVLKGVDALTPSERRIAAMAADGLSNRDIAQALFVTLRTVEMHLSQAFRKLDISTRTQLPGALAASPQTPGGAPAC
jgi:DNA-binding CsgD family transcriptional regulator